MRKLGRILLWGLPILLVLYIVIGSGIIYAVLDRLLVVGKVSDLASVGQPSETPFDLGFRGDPQVAFQLPFETVQVPTPLGDAEAWLIPAGGGGTTWAVFVHGIAGVREGGYRYVPTLHEAGIPTLLITYRNDPGGPRSEEGVYAFGLTEWPDVDAAVSFALARGATRILLIGDSMGGALVGEFLRHSTQTDRLAGVILDAPALSFRMLTEGLVRNVGLPFASTLSTLATSLFSVTHGVRLMDSESLGTVAAFPGPMLLFHGSGDRIVTVAITDRLVAERPGTTTRLRTHADHLQSQRENPALYEWTLRTFVESIATAP